jgi:type IV secretory pathway VirD2 relaxase
MGAGSAKAAALHVRYIVRDGVEKDGSPGVLYGPDGPASVPDFEAPRLYEKHQFRLIVSPEDAHELDLTAYVRGLMAQVARDTGRRLEWAAVNHFDTDHPHAHVVIRGVDLDRREVRLDRAYISNGLRWRAQELATEELGPRPRYDLARQREREIGHDRFTSIRAQVRAPVARRARRPMAHAARIWPSMTREVRVRSRSCNPTSGCYTERAESTRRGGEVVQP